ncbi:TRAFAC clade GTPase domain-containing protein [Pedobacter arcticus]|uniref:TRAFAC clade GTPase domain-containing protein n=1 Tax=Pedobacter arcticus TaxID=752140 RepID=UPI0002DB711A|nr:hypothetical protein [Pedobacter arcticus]
MIAGELEKICKKANCTFSQTGQCVFNNDALTCPQRLESIADLPIEEIKLGKIVLSAPEEMERFSSSLTLTTNDTQKLTRNRYCKVIGILGVPGTGKTASLVSLYLLLAHSKLEGFQFLDSKSIMAFEEISRGARRWNQGQLPDQLTAHTKLQDERIAGYLHLRLQRSIDNTAMDLLLTDLPGEWTTSLLETNRVDRLEFLKAADRIWLTLNAEELSVLKKRQQVVHRASLVIKRIVEYLGGKMPDVTIVVTHSDKTASVVEHLSTLQTLAKGFNITVREIASFSDNEGKPAGFGIKELVEDLLNTTEFTNSEFWPSQPSMPDDRHILKFIIKNN